MSHRVVARVHLSGNEWLLLEDPVTILEAREPQRVPDVLKDIERLTFVHGFHAAGFITYEAGAAFGLRTRHSELRLPLAWFACFAPDRVRRGPLPAAAGDYTLGPLRASRSRAECLVAFDRIRSHLAAGDSYQVNYTFRLAGDFAGDAAALFADLVENQRGAHAAFLHAGDWSICSASPELFFSRDGSRVVMRPMKGTAPRGRTVDEDMAAREGLRESLKQRAENVMIVDMVRNDLGRVAEWGSVEVPELFSVERYPNVWQMTSTVTARTTASLADLFEALHPSASVTGAPKVRTMEILEALEPEPRGVYTGAIGYVAPDGSARFNVAIRTAVIDHPAGSVAFGVGSGIVWDSDADQEYEECLLKGRVLTRREPDMELLETLRWSPGEGFVRLDRHLARLEASAGYFGYVFDGARIRRTLSEALGGSTGERRVRLLLARNGADRVEHTPFVPTTGVVRLTFAAEPVDTENVFLFHKTTRRDVYNRARVDGFDDVVLWNRQGHVTETTTCNIVIEAETGKVTPPVGSGLLAGTLRAQLLAAGEVREAVVTVDALQRSGWCWVVNSLHGWRRGELAGDGPISPDAE